MRGAAAAAATDSIGARVLRCGYRSCPARSDGCRRGGPMRLNPGLSRRALALSFLPLLAAGCRPVAGPPSAAPPAATAPPPDDGPVLSVPGGSLKIQVCTDDIVRVAFARSPAFFQRASLITAPRRCEKTPFQTGTAAGVTTVTTAKLTVRIDAATGAVTFLDAAGQTILAEKAGGGRTVTPATVEGEATASVRQEWAPNDDESLYGLGQHQQGLLDIKGFDLDLHQYNTEVFVPMLVSSRGYGILWDNTSFTRFGDLADAVPLPIEGLYAGAGRGAGRHPAEQRHGRVRGQGHARGHGRLHAPRLLLGDDQALGRRGGRDGSLPAGLAAERGPRAGASRGRKTRCDQAFLAGRPRHEGAPPPVEGPGGGADDVALVAGGRRCRLLVRARPRARRRRRRLSSPDRRGADDAQVGVRPLAVQGALQDLARSRRRLEGLPLARRADRRHRAGLALLAGRDVGLARLRRDPLPGPGPLAPRHPRHVPRPPDDLRVAAVLPGDQDVLGAPRVGLSLSRERRRDAQGLPRPRVRRVRRVQSRRRGASTGRRSTRSSSRRASTRGGSTRARRRSFRGPSTRSRRRSR